MIKLLFHSARLKRTLFVGFIYGLLMVAAYWMAWELRFDFSVPGNFAFDRLFMLGPLVSLKLIFLLFLRQCGTVLSYFSLPDLLRIVVAIAAASILFLIGSVLATYPQTSFIPRSVLLMDFVLSVGAICIFRLGLRMHRERTAPSRIGMKGFATAAEPVAIIGAGDVGANLAKELVAGRNHGLMPVVFLDDDPKKRGGFVHGVPIVGAIDEAARLRETYEFRRVILAIPSAPEKRLREIIELMNRLSLKVDIVPSVRDLATGRMTVSRIRPVEIADLLGRKAANLDPKAIADMVEKRVVMVTGAGGSIGSELCRQIAACNPTRLLLVEQSEPALFVIEQELIANGMGAIIQPLVADVLDRIRMRQLFERYRPSLVFHAAAHKHVFLMERQPAEAVKNNSLGTLVVAEEAIRVGVEKFVFVSTDKAINPTSVMGASKRLAELFLRRLHNTGNAGKTKLMAVRFGNVLGSSGSVVPIFKKQIEAGGPVTVTHPEVTRYFMTIPEAVGLVLQACLYGDGGDIFVLDMGQPVKIADLAKQMIRLSGYEPGLDIEIVFTGLKPGEKLYEELQHHTEAYQTTEHPQIMRFVPEENDFGCLETNVAAIPEALARMEINDVKRWLQRQIPEYKPYFD